MDDKTLVERALTHAKERGYGGTAKKIIEDALEGSGND